MGSTQRSDLKRFELRLRENWRAKKRKGRRLGKAQSSDPRRFELRTDSRKEGRIATQPREEGGNPTRGGAAVPVQEKEPAWKGRGGRREGSYGGREKRQGEDRQVEGGEMLVKKAAGGWVGKRFPRKEGGKWGEEESWRNE